MASIIDVCLVQVTYNMPTGKQAEKIEQGKLPEQTNTIQEHLASTA